jgi:sulfur transfer protein SufE|tara:strand:- start:1061 stop:1459 length:399 start_codon:yes stop_codon:yes gene_type:complete
MHNKIQEWRDLFEELGDDVMLYEHLIDEGRKLQSNPLPEELRTEQNRVSRCQYDLFVARHEDKFKAYSNGMIAGGYAYMLLDIFNSVTLEEVAQCDPAEIGKSIGVKEILSAQRGNGFYQMMDLMKEQANEK